MTEPQRATVTTRRQLRTALTLSTADFSALTGVSRYGVRKGVHDGTIPVVRSGARIRIPAAYARQVLGCPRPDDVPFNGAGS